MFVGCEYSMFSNAYEFIRMFIQRLGSLSKLKQFFTFCRVIIHDVLAKYKQLISGYYNGVGPQTC